MVEATHMTTTANLPQLVQYSRLDPQGGDGLIGARGSQGGNGVILMPFASKNRSSARFSSSTVSTVPSLRNSSFLDSFEEYSRHEMALEREQERNQDSMGRREAFAVSLRRSKKASIIAQRRQKLLQSQNLAQSSQIMAEEAPELCLKSFQKLENFLRRPKHVLYDDQNGLSAQVITCMLEMNSSMKICFRGCKNTMDRQRAIELVTEEGALFNVAQILGFLIKKRMSKPSAFELSRWNKDEVRLLHLCFDFFAFADPKMQYHYGLTHMVFETLRESVRQIQQQLPFQADPELQVQLCSDSDLISTMQLSFLWLHDQLACKEGQSEILKLDPLMLISDFIDNLHPYLMNTSLQAMRQELGENLLLSLGAFLEQLCTSGLQSERMKKFSKLDLYPKLVVAHYIEANTRQLFMQGIGILRSLLKTKSRKSLNTVLEIVFQFEESCGSKSGLDQQVCVHKGVLDILHETLLEALHDTIPADVVARNAAQTPFKVPAPQKSNTQRSCMLVWEIATVYEALLAHVSLPDLRLLIEQKSLINDISFILEWNKFPSLSCPQLERPSLEILREQANLDLVCIQALSSMTNGVAQSNDDGMVSRIVRDFLHGPYSSMTKRFQILWLAQESSVIADWPEGKHLLCVATLGYFGALLRLIDFFDSQFKQQMVQEYGLLYIGIEQLQKLCDTRGSSYKSELIVLRLLTTILVRGQVETTREKYGSECALQDHQLLPGVHQEFLRLNGLQLVENMDALRSSSGETERIEFLNWFTPEGHEHQPNDGK